MPETKSILFAGSDEGMKEQVAKLLDGIATYSLTWVGESGDFENLHWQGMFDSYIVNIVWIYLHFWLPVVMLSQILYYKTQDDGK